MKFLRFLVFGCEGMAGKTISTYLNEQGHDVTGFCRTKSEHIKSITGDIFNKDLVCRVIDEGDYDVVINCVGILNEFAERNHADAVYINSFFPHYLVSLTNEKKTRIFQMSTDCVFSGARGGYTELDFPDGKSFYDRSKALGELVDGKNLTFRNSIVGPDSNVEGIGLLNWFLKQQDRVNGYTRAMWSGITTLELAKVMEFAAYGTASGLINMVYDEPISKFDLLKLFNKHFRDNSLLLNPVDGIIADKSLVRTNFSFEYKVPDYDRMVRELSEWMNNHKSYYPHYNL